MTDLKPCPLCGSTKVADDGYIRDGKRVRCLSCGCSTFAFHPDANAKAIAKWNTRPSLTGEAVAGRRADLIRLADAILSLTAETEATLTTVDPSDKKGLSAALVAIAWKHLGGHYTIDGVNALNAAAAL